MATALVGKKLIEHARKHGAQIGPVAIESMGEMGLGLVATKKLQAGRPFLTIPEKVWRPLSADEAYVQLRDKHPAFLEEIMYFAQRQDISMQARLLLVGSVSFVVHLLKEFANPSEMAALHLESMPKSVSVPLFWGNQQMEFLQSSPLIHKITERRQLIDSIYENAIAPHQKNMPEANLTPSNFSFAWSLLLSRALSDLKSRMPFALPPVLDMMNHTIVAPREENHGMCQHWFDHPNASFIVAPKQDVEPGTQLFISYGNLPNADLLRLYGFTIENNPNDSVDVFAPGPTGPTRVHCSVDGSIEFADDSPRIDSLTLQRTLMEALNAYGTSASDDEKFLASAPNPPRECVDAVRVRLGEKKSIQRALAKIQEGNK